MNYEDMLDTVVANAWEVWTNNDMGMDWEQREETEKHVYNIAANSYYDGMSIAEWTDEVIRKINGMRV